MIEDYTNIHVGSRMNVFRNMPIGPAARVKGLKQNTCIKHTDEQTDGQGGRQTPAES